MMMKSSQINFYITPDDVLQIDSYIKEKGLLILSHPMKTEKLKIVDSLLSEEDTEGSEKFITAPELESQIVIKHINTQNYYLIDVIQSPVIEFFFPHSINNKMLRGRMYYVKTFFTSSKVIAEKDNEFLSAANNLFKWIRKNLKNVKYAGFEKFIVTKNMINHLEKSNGQLLLNNIL